MFIFLKSRLLYLKNLIKEFLSGATPDEAQQKDTDFLLSLGELFTLVVYGQLILENAKIYELEEDMVDQIFDFMIRDFSGFALNLYCKAGSTELQMDYFRKMIRKPALNPDLFQRVWRGHVLALSGVYEMNP